MECLPVAKIPEDPGCGQGVQIRAIGEVYFAGKLHEYLEAARLRRSMSPA
jgi:hypothetical protein